MTRCPSAEDLKDAIRAALLRVEPELAENPVALDRELAHELRAVPIRPDGRIYWSNFKLGLRLRDVMLREQDGRCCYCAEVMELIGKRDVRVSFDHVVPLGCGGADHPGNLVLACGYCNHLRSHPNRRTPKRL